MQIIIYDYVTIIKLNNHLEDTKVREPLTKPYAEKCELREIFISEILFCFSVELPASEQKH